MLGILSYDIGGANTKAAYIKVEEGFVREIKTASKYLPIWKNPNGLNAVLLELSERVAGSDKFDAVGVTITAELSDAYETKREGVHRILTNVAEVFPEVVILVLDVNGSFRHIERAKEEPLHVAAANWAATGWLVSQLVSNCIVVDVGSTSTSIIPIVNRAVSAVGKTDLEKLVCGELVYTGCLRTNVATIVNHMPIKKDLARVSSELFATSGDIHLVLGNITSEEFAVETADGRGKTRTAALARIARVVCADEEVLSEKEIIKMAQYVCERQIEQISDGLRQVYEQVARFANAEFTIVLTGLGKDFLARKAAEKLGFSKIVDFDNLVPGGVAKVSTVVSLAFMIASDLGGRVVQWER